MKLQNHILNIQFHRNKLHQKKKYLKLLGKRKIDFKNHPTLTHDIKRVKNEINYHRERLFHHLYKAKRKKMEQQPMNKIAARLNRYINMANISDETKYHIRQLHKIANVKGLEHGTNFINIPCKDCSVGYPKVHQVLEHYTKHGFHINSVNNSLYNKGQTVNNQDFHEYSLHKKNNPSSRVNIKATNNRLDNDKSFHISIEHNN